ncbi:hypothetical protein [Streptomyces sp. CA-111067]|uniref:hypothetical protein n=1 Tax=Streptomyces sp. CA-111067 TaxID=3240046 RepID=UPI003D9908AA
MICKPCADAADARVGRDQHCDDPKCMCGHRTDRYRPVSGLDAVAHFYDQLRRIVDQATEVHHRDTVRPISGPLPTPTATRPGHLD